ncbi:Com family DNA-binding transcriptional regulator [Modicisalibacter sp. MOD 31.J]|uniref:Com family DNA-binding transcriptional regulator n=1 Tax=Modicisalibacter sp. MOD 31.J TaxID=2831897 RepID=UPI001CCE1199|nr:Com family DNA-binding transcriptional regulator [Modicisalibacter sp. MOD 31.J]MBZ9574428.1 Com family DNA-binding transcriptional regulator [Modicisalibacter sp. MOD 31.J]
MALKEIRCGGCNRMLARASQFDTLEIKCPRCGRLNTQRATSSMPNRKQNRGSTDNPVDGRQASPR